MQENSYIVHATVYKYDEGLEAETKANSNTVVKAYDRGEAIEKATENFEKDYEHPKVSNIKVEIQVVDII